jgi:prevent-host-death family protein
MSQKPTRSSRHPRAHEVSATTFKATCLELMDDVARTRSELIVTKHGRPVVRVSAVEPPIISPIGFLEASVASHGDIVSPDHSAWAESATDPLAPRHR